ncbi:MAG: hypothetical protein IJ833_04445 [Lachnospiraceae bacterium]|nr:hypothetical protein [Lachnospiraceae bacterium]
MSTLSSWNSNSINALFGSGSTSKNNSADLYGLFTERKSIQSGAYKQTLKAYYNSQGTDTNSTASSTKKSTDVLNQILDSKKNPTVSKTTKEANSTLTTGLSSLKSSVSALQSDSSYANVSGNQTVQDKVGSLMKSFVSEYNNVVKAAKDSNLESKTANVASMMRSTATNADKLAEIGVTVNTDGTLALDEKALKSVDVSKVQELFSGSDITSYGSTIASRLGYATGNSTTDSVASTTAAKQETNTSAAGVKADARALASSDLYAKVKDKDGNVTDQYDVASILSTVKSYADNYNKMFDAAESSTNSGVSANLTRIKETTARNADALSQFGISVGSNGRLSVNEDVFKNADMAQVKNTFQDYGSSVATSASLVNYYMGTQADASNGYTSNAAYNLEGNSTYTTTM